MHERGRERENAVIKIKKYNIRMHEEAREGIIKITNALHESGRVCRVFIRLQTFVPLFCALPENIFHDNA